MNFNGYLNKYDTSHGLLREIGKQAVPENINLIDKNRKTAGIPRQDLLKNVVLNDNFHSGHQQLPIGLVGDKSSEFMMRRSSTGPHISDLSSRMGHIDGHINLTSNMDNGSLMNDPNSRQVSVEGNYNHAQGVPNLLMNDYSEKVMGNTSNAVLNTDNIGGIHNEANNTKEFQKALSGAYTSEYGALDANQEVSNQYVANKSPIQFHHPFDLNSYPITNPPLFDTTMMLGLFDGVPRRRGLSISNGQIGQIVSHEMDQVKTGSSSSNEDDSSFVSFPRSTLANDSVNFAPESRLSGYKHLQAEEPLQKRKLLSQSKSTEPIRNQAEHNTQVRYERTRPKAEIKEESLSDTAGVPPPSHQLLYNHEVIFNRDDGPIPGTALWKKERLLERNRVAASKCRQRKKQAQKQLQDAVLEYENEVMILNLKVKKYELLFELYNSELKRYFDSHGNSDIGALKNFVNKESIDDIAHEELE